MKNICIGPINNVAELNKVWALVTQVGENVFRETPYRYCGPSEYFALRKCGWMCTRPKTGDIIVNINTAIRILSSDAEDNNPFNKKVGGI